MRRSRAYKYIEYCRRDTEITGRFVETMLKKYDEIDCEPKTTIAATTLHYFEQKYYKKVTHSFTEKQIDWFHTGYYGGRCEIFHNLPLKGPVWYHDLNFLYPYCMKTGMYPDLDVHYESKKPDLSLFGAADCIVQAPRELLIPYLPCRSDGKLIFPLGRWRGVYTFFELTEAQKLGYRIQKIHRAIECPGAHNPFEPFIDAIYTERLKAKASGDELLDMVFKAFGNFAYGKYAQGNETTELIPVSQMKEIPSGTVIFDGNLALIHRKRKYPRYANCLWAMYVTAYARHRLYYHGFKRVLGAGARLIYCDTDSVMYQADAPVLEHSKELGEFKLEGIYKETYFKLPKLYYLIPYSEKSEYGRIFKKTTNKSLFDETVYKAKGVPRETKIKGKIRYPKQEYFHKNKAIYVKPNKLRESLRRNYIDPEAKKPKIKTRLLVPNYWEVREKEVSGKYNKRIVLKDGSTLPLTLKMEPSAKGSKSRGRKNGKSAKKEVHTQKATDRQKSKYQGFRRGRSIWKDRRTQGMRQ